jgi:hypothetical protein
MASTKRGKILENLRSVIEGLSSVTKCEVNSSRALHDIDSSVLPYVNLVSSATLNPGKTGVGSYERWDLEVSVWVITLDDNVEDIRGDIKEVIALDKKRGGHASDTTYESDENNPELDIPAGAQSLTINITIKYHVEGGKKI